MPSLSLRFSLSGWVTGCRRSLLAASKAHGSFRQVLEEAGKDIDAKNCIRGSGGQREDIGELRGMVAMARGSGDCLGGVVTVGLRRLVCARIRVTPGDRTGGWVDEPVIGEVEGEREGRRGFHGEPRLGFPLKRSLMDAG